MGSIGNMLFGGGEGASSGGVSGSEDLTRGLQDTSNELLVGLGATRKDREGLVQGLTQQLQAQAAGTGPSIAEAQLKMAMDRNLSQQLAAAKANKAVNPALQARALSNAANQQAQQVAQQSAVNRMAEQQQGQQQLGALIGQQYQMSTGARTGALGGAAQSANINAANQARSDRMVQGLAQGAAAAYGASDKNMKKLVRKYNKGGIVAATSAADFAGSGKILNIAGGEDINKYYSNLVLPTAQKQKDPFADALAANIKDKQIQLPAAGGPVAPSQNNFLNMMASGAQTLSASKGALVPGQAPVNGDSVKNDIVPALVSPGEVIVPRTIVNKGAKAVAKFVAKAIKEEKSGPNYAEGGQVAAQDKFSPESFLKSLQAVSFEYKDKNKKSANAGDDRYLGVMAQDLEKAGPVGRSMVKEGADGKQVDFGKGFAAILASQAYLNKKMEEMEKKKVK